MQECGLNNFPPLKGNTPAHQSKKYRREGNNSQPADLKEENRNHLAGKREVLRDVDTGQARNADCGGGTKEGIDKGKVPPRGRERKPQEKASQQDE